MSLRGVLDVYRFTVHHTCISTGLWPPGNISCSFRDSVDMQGPALNVVVNQSKSLI